MINLHINMGLGSPGIKLMTHGSAIGLTTDCATRPSQYTLYIKFVCSVHIVKNLKHHISLQNVSCGPIKHVSISLERVNCIHQSRKD